MSGSIDITPGYQLGDGEKIDNSKINRMTAELIAQLDPNSVTARELADGSISADKLDADITSQLGSLGSIEDGAVTTSKLADGAVTTPKVADGAITAVKLAPDALRPNEVKYFQAQNGSFHTIGPLSVIPGCQVAIPVEVDDIIEVHGQVTIESADCLLNCLQQNNPGIATPLLNVPMQCWDRGTPHSRLPYDVYSMWRADASGTLLLSMWTAALHVNAQWNVYSRYLIAKRIGNGISA